MSGVFTLDERTLLVPVMHGSGDYAVALRRLLLETPFDTLAVPLPASFRDAVCEAIVELPQVRAVVQRESTAPYGADSDDDLPSASYVPIDPCQPVIAALRLALQEQRQIEFIDLETAHFRPASIVLPDPYALKRVRLEHFATAVLPSVQEPRDEQTRERCLTMGHRLYALSRQSRRTIALCALHEWPWVRAAWAAAKQGAVASSELPEDDPVEEVETYPVAARTLLFLLGELPFVTALYEQARATLDDDENLSVDGIKSLWLATRDRYQAELGNRARKITPKLMKVAMQYLRNLSLMHRRLTPDFYTLVVAARQIAGDRFALTLAEQAAVYFPQQSASHESLQMGTDRARLPDGDVLRLYSRLPGPPVEWRSLSLKAKPDVQQQFEWQQRWNPFRQCSYPPEDVAIEKFRTHVKDVAISLLGVDLARSEKFSTSLKDGLDIRETLRNWHTGELYVKVLPPSRGSLDCVVMLFDSPADPRDYPHRVTWYAEHQDESTLAFFGSNPYQTMVGPGIAQATYGGALFLFPPRPIPDIWTDRRLNAADTLEERMLMAGCLHARERHVAVLSHLPPGPGWRRLAKRFGRKLIHVPLGRFSQETLQRLRVFHILNGQHVRSYAADFIRDA